MEEVVRAVEAMAEAEMVAAARAVVARVEGRVRRCGCARGRRRWRAAAWGGGYGGGAGWRRDEKVGRTSRSGGGTVAAAAPALSVVTAAAERPRRGRSRGLLGIRRGQLEL